MPRVSTCMGTESEHEVLSSLHRYRHSAGRGSAEAEGARVSTARVRRASRGCGRDLHSCAKLNSCAKPMGDSRRQPARATCRMGDPWVVPHSRTMSANPIKVVSERASQPLCPMQGLLPDTRRRFSFAHRWIVRRFLGAAIWKLPWRFSHSMIAFGVTPYILRCASRKVGSV